LGLPVATLQYKRFRMEIDLVAPIAELPLPAGYAWVPWSHLLVERHAQVKARCFHGETDATIFPSLGSVEGCRRLMRDISRRTGFEPEATWLITCDEADVGTIQGVVEGERNGAIQNVGIVTEHRCRGLGTRLVTRSLNGFYRVGVTHVRLEVTADNASAVRVYEKVGFRATKVLYKTVTRAGVP